MFNHCSEKDLWTIFINFLQKMESTVKSIRYVSFPISFQLLGPFYGQPSTLITTEFFHVYVYIHNLEINLSTWRGWIVEETGKRKAIRMST